MQDKISVVLSGMPGNMATAAMGAINKQDDMNLVLFALTGSREKTQEQGRLNLVAPDSHKLILSEVKQSYPNFIVVDYSKAEIENRARLYAEVSVPFVYGGTIGDRCAAEEIVRAGDISAVIAPNMSKQIVAWTSALEYLAREFPGAFDGYNGHLTESHQRTKRDPSGTGRAWTVILKNLGINFDEMQSIRDPEVQRNQGVPQEYIDGHAYHWVDIQSRDGTVNFGFCTKVNGRQTYADGTPDAVRYLYRAIQSGTRGKVFSMVDVLRG